MTKKDINFLLVGVGGQGTLLASDILAELGVRLGYDVKKAEVHGMSQRGGSVTSYVRWGGQVFSPIIGKGEVDILVAFEKLEALRYLDQLRPGGIVLVNDQAIEPITVKAGDVKYPDDALVRSTLAGAAGAVHWVDGQEIAESVGNPKTANVAILGALSALLDTPEGEWLEAVKAHVPEKHIAINKKAFLAG
ncbi:MAG: indolepyruvate oxidoreductase subunit beta, partial [Anaerolineales bacterium]|nr:indolepyruvate oxidoreductase subunit beta [Anaerolineales bacterium]